jgi:hypothetical protein
VSTDASLFPIHFFDCNIFCVKCTQVKKFKIFSQEKYDKNYDKSRIPPHKPLFCKCEECGGTVIYATNEFSELQEEPTLELCKIWGKGSLEAGDRVFHPTEKLCMIENVNRIYGATMPQITLRKQNNEKVDVQVDFKEIFNENDSAAFYRLFPQNGEDARIGEKIYHTEMERIGEVIGLEFNGGQKIIVRFENGDIEKCHCKNNANYLTDKLLELNTQWRCRNSPNLRNLQIYSRAKVLNISCFVQNFNSIGELNKIISSIPQARCSIMHVVVERATLNSNYIYKELLKNNIHICCCHIEYQNQEVYITGFYSGKNTQKDIYRVLSRFSIKKITLDIKIRPSIKIIKTINRDNCFIKISKMEKKVHIDGWVKSEKEKGKATLKAFFYSFSFKIENHLLVIN